MWGSDDVSSSSGQGGGGNHSNGKRLNFDASRSSGVYNRTDNRIIPTGVIVMGIIKY